MESGRETWKMILGGIAVVYVIIFVLINDVEVKINFLFFTATTSVLVGFLLIGALGFLIGFFSHSRYIRNRIQD